MQEHPILGQVALGYSPLIDPRREVIATRLTVFPGRPDQTPDVAALLAALDDVWPPPAPEGLELNLQVRPLEATRRPLDPPRERGAAAAAPPPAALNVAHEGMLLELMRLEFNPLLMLEIPAFMAGDEAHAQSIRALRDSGRVLLIKGRPLQPLAPDVLACFSHSLVEAADDRRAEAAASTRPRGCTTVQAGVRSAAEADQAFQRGAVAVQGWCFGDAATKPGGRGGVAADIRTVMELIDGVDRELPVPRLEALLKREPTVAFRLLRYLNSPGFGLSVEVSSLAHALMLLGYQRLKRWLAVLLASSSKERHANAMMFAAVRRGLLMEELARPGDDTEMRGEMFICGVFSLLDRLLQQPMKELLGSVPVPERVRLSLVQEGGPYEAHVELAQAIEQESLLAQGACRRLARLGRKASESLRDNDHPILLKTAGLVTRLGGMPGERP